MTYLITFACYGCHLHGHDAGSVDRAHHTHGTPIVEANPARAAFERKQMNQPPYLMDQPRRDAVLAAIQEVCSHPGWNHIHTIVEAEVEAERIMADFKAYPSRSLNRLKLDPPTRQRWSRHGSTRWLWKPQNISAAMQYVIAEQGDAMSVASE